jgi:hypothetical protein
MDISRVSSMLSRHLHLDTRRLPLLQHVIDRMLRDEAQVTTANLHGPSFGLELVASKVKVDFLAAEVEGVPAKR